MSANDDDISTSSSVDVSPTAPQQLKPDCNVELERSGVVAPRLMARNAQNPTVERNTHHGSSEDLEVDGNTLVSRRAVDQGSADAAAVSQQQPDSSQMQTQRPRLSGLRPDQLQRISYVQNVVDNGTAPTASAPKRQNVDSQTRWPCELDSEADMNRAGACQMLMDDDDDASHNTAAAVATAATAGDNLGYESSLSPCFEVASPPPPPTCLV